MIETDQLQKIGQVLKSYGTDGSLVIRLYDFAQGGFPVETKEPVYILWDGLPVPYFISDASPKGSGKYLCRLTDINTLADAEEISGRHLYSPMADESSEDIDFIGWTVQDSRSGRNFTVSDIEDIPGNPCLVVNVPPSAEEVLIPLHENLVEHVDGDSRTIRMHIPEGLLETTEP